MRLFAKILVYGALIPVTLVFFVGIAFMAGDRLRGLEWLLIMTPGILAGLHLAHGRWEQLLDAYSKNRNLQAALNKPGRSGQIAFYENVAAESGKIVGLSLWQFLTGKKRLETPEEAHDRIWAEKDHPMLRYAQRILAPDEEVLYHARIYWEGENDRIKWAWLAALFCFVSLLVPPFPRACMGCLLFMMFGAPLWMAWASYVMQGNGCVVTNRRIIVRHNFYALVRRRRFISHIPLDRVREVIVSQRRWERKADTGSIRIRCASGADITRLTYALEGNDANAYPLPERERGRLKNAALSWPLHHVRKPFALKKFIEGRILR